MVVYKLYKSATQFAIEAYVSFLVFLQRRSYQVAVNFRTANVIDEAMKWVLYALDEVKFNVVNCQLSC